MLKCGQAAQSPVHRKQESRDPQLPKSVPMPAQVQDIQNAEMRAMWEMDGEAAPEPLGS